MFASSVYAVELKDVVSTVSEKVRVSSSVSMFRSKYNSFGCVTSGTVKLTISASLASTGTNKFPFISVIVYSVSDM